MALFGSEQPFPPELTGAAEDRATPLPIGD
jgi:hypothetical protein